MLCAVCRKMSVDQYKESDAKLRAHLPLEVVVEENEAS